MKLYWVCRKDHSDSEGIDHPFLMELYDCLTSEMIEEEGCKNTTQARKVLKKWGYETVGNIHWNTSDNVIQRYFNEKQEDL